MLNGNHNHRTNDSGDDDEDYPFDDEQLEEEIAAYDEFRDHQKRQMQMLRLQQAQQQHQQAFYRQPFHQNGIQTPRTSSHNLQMSKKFDSTFIPEVGENYFDFAPDSVYMPNSRSKRMMNYYVHEARVNPENGVSKGDALASFWLRKNSMPDDILDEYDNSETPKKKGRPPKSGTDADEMAKAKIILEKCYLQETACNRECLQKNAKAFKKFRLYTAMQNKEENEKVFFVVLFRNKFISHFY